MGPLLCFCKFGVIVKARFYSWSRARGNRPARFPCAGPVLAGTPAAMSAAAISCALGCQISGWNACGVPLRNLLLVANV